MSRAPVRDLGNGQKEIWTVLSEPRVQPDVALRIVLCWGAILAPAARNRLRLRAVTGNRPSKVPNGPLQVDWGLDAMGSDVRLELGWGQIALWADKPRLLSPLCLPFIGGGGAR